MRKKTGVLTLAIALILCLVNGFAQAETLKPDVRPSDPVIARADVVYFDTSINGFCPYIARTKNGDLIIAISTRGDGMPRLKPEDVDNNFVRSSDGGKTWKRYMTSRADKPLTGLGEIFYTLPGNRILRYSLEPVWSEMPDQAKSNFLTICAQTKFNSYYAISKDNGYTFSKRKPLLDPASDPVKRYDFAQGNIVELKNGDLLWSWGDWGKGINGFKRSTDRGLTWGPLVTAYKGLPPGYPVPNETGAAVCKDGSVVVVSRVDGAPDNDKRFWTIKSSDNGKTWTTPRQIEIQGGSPALFCAPNGQLWLAYRDGGYGPGLGLAVSDDTGASWRYLYHLKEPLGNHERMYGNIRYTDEDRKQTWRPSEGNVGYPTFVKLSDTEVYVVYHALSYPTAQTFYIAGNLLQIPKPTAKK